jgi:competence protein ComK
MKLQNEFIVKYGTIMFYPENDENGNLHTRIFDNHSVYQVDVCPSELIDTNLKYYGSSLKGARDGASMILGGRNMTPIVVNAKGGIYWFPSKSPSSRDCIWFALHQIKHYEKISDGKTLVTFYNESTFKLEVSYYSFDKRVKEAYKLKCKIDERTNEIPVRVAEIKAKFHFNKNNHNLNYGVIKV